MIYIKISGQDEQDIEANLRSRFDFAAFRGISEGSSFCVVIFEVHNENKRIKVDGRSGFSQGHIFSGYCQFKQGNKIQEKIHLGKCVSAIKFQESSIEIKRPKPHVSTSN